VMEFTASELRRWAVEQAIASFGSAGCADSYNLTCRVEELYRYVIGPRLPSDAPQQQTMEDA